MWRSCLVSAMNKIVLSAEAQADLINIRDYITTELENPEAALRVVSSITQRLFMLQEHAMLGARLSSALKLESNYRFLVCGNYHAFYRVEKTTIYVDRILYYRQDFMRALFGIEQH